jgi:hypothetical protein
MNQDQAGRRFRARILEYSMALDGFQGGEPNEHEMQRIEPPRRQGRQVEKERLREIKQRKSGIYLSSYTLSPSWRAWRLGGSILRWN